MTSVGFHDLYIKYLSESKNYIGGDDRKLIIDVSYRKGWENENWIHTESNFHSETSAYINLELQRKNFLGKTVRQKPASSN